MKSIGAQPVPIRILRSDLFLDFIISHDAALVRIDQEDTTWLKAALFHHSGRINFKDPNLRRHDHKVI